MSANRTAKSARLSNLAFDTVGNGALKLQIWCPILLNLQALQERSERRKGIRTASRAFRVHQTHSIFVPTHRLLPLEPAPGRCRRAGHAPLDIGDRADGARRPAGADGLAPHVELLCRRFLVEKSAPARDQMARGHVARRGRHRRCRDGHGARPGTVLGPPDQSRQSARHGTGNRRHQGAPSGVDCRAG